MNGLPDLIMHLRPWLSGIGKGLANLKRFFGKK